MHKYTDQDEKFNVNIYLTDGSCDEYKNVRLYRFQKSDGSPSSYMVAEDNGNRHEYFPVNINEVHSSEINPIREYKNLNFILVNGQKLEFENVIVQTINDDDNPRYIIRKKDDEIESNYVIPTCNILDMNVEYFEL